MANLLVTTNCQRNCSYCFAKGDRQKGMIITWDNFITALKFISTGPKALNLLGGEPTLHPEFDHMLAYLLEQDFMVQVFTNGMLKDEMLGKVKKVLKRITLRENQLYFAVNVNEEENRTEEEDRLQKRFLDEMGRLAYLSFTIYRKTNLLFLHKMIEEHYLDHTIRLGLSMPIHDVDNTFLPIDSYREAAESIIELSDNSPGTTITFDCGFPLCMFHMEEISELIKNRENDFSFICGVPLDIYPDLSMTNCYPLSTFHKNHISNFPDIATAYKFFEEGFMAPTGIYGEKCNSCQFFKKACHGGCKGFAAPTAS